jgi:hypothetical protein
MRYDEGGVLFSPKRVKCVVLPVASDGGRSRKERAASVFVPDGGGVAQRHFFLVPATPG